MPHSQAFLSLLLPLLIIKNKIMIYGILSFVGKVSELLIYLNSQKANDDFLKATNS